MSGWERLWQDPEVVRKWAGALPVDEVVAMADRLEAEDRRRVLDVGCGLGRHTIYLAARGFDVVGVDSAPSALAACRARLSEAGLKATLVEGEMTALSFPDGRFDGVIAAYAIHHAYRFDIEQIIASITRMLGPQGLLVWVTPTPRHFQCGRGEEVEAGTWVDPSNPEGPIPHHFSTADEVRELLAAYEVESMREHQYRENGNSRWHWCILARKRCRVA